MTGFAKLSPFGLKLKVIKNFTNFYSSIVKNLGSAIALKIVNLYLLLKISLVARLWSLIKCAARVFSSLNSKSLVPSFCIKDLCPDIRDLKVWTVLPM